MRTEHGDFFVEASSKEHLIITSKDGREIHIIGGGSDPKLVAEIYATEDSDVSDARCYHIAPKTTA